MIRKGIFSLLLLLVVIAGKSQGRQIRFENIDITDGLSQSLVNDIIQDRLGYIWIATQDGLNRFDGSRFVVYKKDPQDKNSLSHNFINAIVEDANGILWIGTIGGGLNHFDPNTRKFERYQFGENYRNIQDLAIDDKGYLWMATTSAGLVRFNTSTGELTSYLEKGLDVKNINVVLVTRQGDVLAGTSGRGVFKFDANNDVFAPVSHPSIDPTILSLFEDKDGTIWIGTKSGLVSFYDDQTKIRVERYLADPMNRYSLTSSSVKAVAVSSNNWLLVGTTGSGLDIADLSKSSLMFYNHQQNEFNPNSLADNLIQCILEDNSGSIWVGTNNGLSRFDPLKQVFDQINFEVNNSNSLNDKNVWGIHEDKRGILWVGTRQGLNRVDRKNNFIARYTHVAHNENAVNNNSILSVHVDEKGRIWAGAVDGLFKVVISEDARSANFVPVPFRRGLNRFSDPRIYDFEEDDKGFLWVAGKEGLTRLNTETGEFLFFENIPSDVTSLPSNVVRVVFQDSRKNIWLGADGVGLVKVIIEKTKNGKDRISFKSYQNALSNQNEDEGLVVTSIWEEKDGLFWVGTYGSGLICFDPFSEKVVAKYTEKEGLSNNAVYGVLGDGKNSLWMSTNNGLSRYNMVSNKFQNYLEKDGLQSNEFNVGAFHRSSRGELFFGGINGLNAFFPEDIKKNEKPPRTVITDVLLFNKAVGAEDEEGNPIQISSASSLTFSHLQNSLTFQFSALHYSNPSNNRYKYMMEGLDDDYIDAGTQTEAHYNKIPHGSYTFKVLAANSDGVWATKPAQIRIVINPPFWATWWFRTIVVLVVLGVFMAWNQSRLAFIKKQRLRLAKEVRERTREVTEQKEKIEQQKKLLEEEKNKVEKLLLNILPENTAEELKVRGKASPRSYRQTTVMFTDFVGFTKIAEKMRPSELVATLDSYFIKFDEIIQKYNLEKIKTIGDSYMCAGGVPIRSKTNPIETVLAALDIQRYMNSLKDNPEFAETAWDLRIGINTGEVIAGVIGIKRFAYDIWGNTVNTANRLQITSEPNMINISGSTYAEIEPYFECTYRGKIAAKNKGEIDMYYVHGIKPELSVDGLGIEPNEKFWKYVNLYLYSSINYKKAERHIMKILREKLPDNLYYHGIHHTYDVVKAAERLALMEGITDEQMFLLKSAATYHDAGFVERYEKNEPIGIQMSKEILPKYGYTPDQVEIVSGLINATIIPHNPQTHLQQIICDADLDYLGRDDFHAISDTLRQELSERGIVKSMRQWDEMQIKFLNMHKYFTESAIKMRQAKKDKHLQDVVERLERGGYPDGS